VTDLKLCKACSAAIDAAVGTAEVANVLTPITLSDFIDVDALIAACPVFSKAAQLARKAVK
jgi:hypothetical protein